MNSESSHSPASKIVTMCGWSIAAWIRPSRRKRSLERRVHRQRPRQDLQRDGAPERELARLVDDAHPAVAEDPLDLVSGDLGALVQHGQPSMMSSGGGGAGVGGGGGALVGAEVGAAVGSGPGPGVARRRSLPGPRRALRRRQRRRACLPPRSWSSTRAPPPRAGLDRRSSRPASAYRCRHHPSRRRHSRRRTRRPCRPARLRLNRRLWAFPLAPGAGVQAALNLLEVATRDPVLEVPADPTLSCDVDADPRSGREGSIGEPLEGHEARGRCGRGLPRSHGLREAAFLSQRTEHPRAGGAVTRTSEPGCRSLSASP